MKIRLYTKTLFEVITILHENKTLYKDDISSYTYLLTSVPILIPSLFDVDT
jgi:hypothetical protein